MGLASDGGIAPPFYRVRDRGMHSLIRSWGAPWRTGFGCIQSVERCAKARPTWSDFVWCGCQTAKRWLILRRWRQRFVLQDHTIATGAFGRVQRRVGTSEQAFHVVTAGR